MQARITAELVKKLVMSRPERWLLVHDTELQGFQVRQMPTGRISYYVRLWIAGQQRVPKIGSYPAMKVPAAREQAEQKLADAMKGIDPTEAARRARGTPTLGEAADLYFVSLERRKRAKRTLSTYRGRWRRHGQKLARLKVNRITYADIEELHHSIAATAEADMTIRLLRAILNWAAHPARAWIRDNPARGFEPRHRQPRRKRAIPLDQVGLLAERMTAWRQGDLGQRRTVWLLELLALTGGRLNELLQAKLEHLGPDHLAVPANREGNPDKLIRLGAAARAVVAEARAATSKRWLFPSYFYKDKAMAAPYAGARALFAAAGVPWTGFHGTRHTFASVARARQLTLDQIAELLGHASPEMAKIYAEAWELGRQGNAELVDEALGRALGRLRVCQEGCGVVTPGESLA